MVHSPNEGLFSDYLDQESSGKRAVDAGEVVFILRVDLDRLWEGRTMTIHQIMTKNVECIEHSAKAEDHAVYQVRSNSSVTSLVYRYNAPFGFMFPMPAPWFQ